MTTTKSKFKVTDMMFLVMVGHCWQLYIT